MTREQENLKKEIGRLIDEVAATGHGYSIKSHLISILDKFNRMLELQYEQIDDTITELKSKAEGGQENHWMVDETFIYVSEFRYQSDFNDELYFVTRESGFEGEKVKHYKIGFNDFEVRIIGNASGKHAGEINLKIGKKITKGGE